MNALVRTRGKIQHEPSHPDPVPGPGESLVRVLWAGICGTDLELAAGYGAFEGVPGHEFVGVVESGAAGEPPGTLVVGDINASCGACPSCLGGEEHHCPHRTVLGIVGRDGAFAEHLVLPSRNLVPLPDGFPPRLGVFVEPLAAAYEIPEQIPGLAARRALVLGDGRLATLIAQVLRLEGAEVRVLGHHERKLGFLRELGFQAVAVPPRAWRRDRFSIVVEATGRGTAVLQAIDWVRPRGIVVLKTTVVDDAVSLPLSRIVVDEISLVGSRCGPLRPAVDALATGRVRIPLTSCEDYALEDFERAFEDTRSGRVFKALFRIGARDGSAGS